MQNVHFSRKYYLFLIIFLGMMSAFGPFVTDMYLPTLPSMATIFNTTASLVQFGLAASMMGLAVGQIFFGPLSDKYGRRTVLIQAMILFSISTLASIFSPNIQFFNICRFFQGLGGAGGIVLSRSIATDCYSGRELAKTLAIIGAVNGVAPVTAPIVGGLVASSIGWQGIFAILFAIGLVLLCMCLIFKESLQEEKRHHGKVSSLMKSFPKLLRIKRFRQFVLMFGFANGVLFAYISSASFIIQDYFGFSELTFSLIFAVNSVAIGTGAALALRFKNMLSAAMFGASAMTLTSMMLAGGYVLYDSFIVFEILIFLTLVFTGFIFTSSTTLAMDEGRESVGAASAIFGATGFMFGGIVSPLVGLGNIMSTTITITGICALCALGFAVASRRNRRVEPETATEG